MSDASADDELDEAIARVKQAFGEAAADALFATLKSRDFARVDVGGSAGCFWAEGIHVGGDGNDVETTFVFDGDSWREASGVDAWSTSVASHGIDVTSDAGRDAILDAFAELGCGRVATERGIVEFLVRKNNADWFQAPTPAHADALDLFEPPHFEGNVFVFQANLPEYREREDGPVKPAYARITLDVVTHAVAVSVLCRGRGNADTQQPVT